MSTTKTRKKTWGGARPGAGRKDVKTKKKISVSVNEQIWQAALNHWQDAASRLVENLLKVYVEQKQAGGA